MKNGPQDCAVVVAAIALQAALMLALRGFALRQAVAGRVVPRHRMPLRRGIGGPRPFRHSVTLRDVVVGQPPGFPPGEFIRVREFRVVLPPAQPSAAEFLVREMLVDIPVLTVVVNKDGDVNVEKLQESLGVEVSAPTVSRGVQGADEADELIERFVENPEAAGRLAPSGPAAPESPTAGLKPPAAPERGTRIEKLVVALGETVTRTADGEERRVKLASTRPTRT